MAEMFNDEHGFLSNGYPCVIRAMGKVWSSAEHLYQASKTEDENERAMIQRARTVAEAREFGKIVKIRSGFDQLKVETMRKIIDMKFRQNPLLALKLVETEPEEIFKGISNGKEESWISDILMETRASLMDNNSSSNPL